MPLALRSLRAGGGCGDRGAPTIWASGGRAQQTLRAADRPKSSPPSPRARAVEACVDARARRGARVGLGGWRWWCSVRRALAHTQRPPRPPSPSPRRPCRVREGEGQKTRLCHCLDSAASSATALDRRGAATTRLFGQLAGAEADYAWVGWATTEQWSPRPRSARSERRAKLTIRSVF